MEALRTPARYLVTVALFGLSTSCANTQTVTNRDLEYTGHPTRIYITSNLGKLGDSFAEELQKRMVADIESCGGHVVFDRVGATELDQDRRRQQIQEFKADVVLTMELANWETMQGSVVGASVDSRVWDVSTKKVVWRGNSTIRTGTITPASTKAESLYKDLMPRLRADRMIPSCSGR